MSTALFDLAHDRNGVIWIGDAGPAGMTPRRLRARARRESWEELHPGSAWLAPGSRRTAVRELSAATLVTGGAASRFSLLRLHGLIEVWPPRPQVLVPYARVGTRVPGIDVRRSRTLRPHHLSEAKGIGATTVERSLADAAPTLSWQALRNLLIDAEQAGMATVDSFRRLRSELPRGVPGLRTMDRALQDLSNSRSDSLFEHEVRTGLRRAGMTVHPEPFPFRCRDGRLVHLDIAIPDAWVAVECDGRAYHSDRRAFTVDRTRWTQIGLDWRLVWVTWDRWTGDPAAVIEDVRRAVEASASGPGRAPAPPARP